MSPDFEMYKTLPDGGAALKALMEAAEAHFFRDRLDEARTGFLAVWEQFPENWQQWQMPGLFVTDRLRAIAFQQGDYPLALAWSEQVLKVGSPKSHTMLSDVGEAHYEMGDLEQAFEWFARAEAQGGNRTFKEMERRYVTFYKEEKARRSKPAG